jgi:DNA-binding MarR family transcriptional regulator
VSGRIVKEVLENAPESLTRLDLLVLVSLAESARDGDRQTRGGAASAEVVAFRVRSTPSSVRNALSRLVARGLIHPMHEKARRGLAQQYRVAQLHQHHREL